MFCHVCGSPTSEGAAFCPACGANLAQGDASFVPSTPPVGVPLAEMIARGDRIERLKKELSDLRGAALYARNEVNRLEKSFVICFVLSLVIFVPALVAFICALPDIGNRLAADGSEGSAAIAGAVAFFLWTALGIASAPSAIYVAKEFLCNRNVATGLAWGLPVFAEIAVGTYIGPVGLIAHFFYQHKKCKNLEENAKVIEARADAIQSELENA